MKPVKMVSLALAALAALTAMAFTGASSALAESTSLCREDVASVEGEACPEGERIWFVHEETPLLGGKLLSSIGTIECNILFLGNVENFSLLGNPLVIEGKFTYSLCFLGTTKCEVKETSAKSTVKILKLGHELADVTVSGEENVHCGAFINCTYNGAGLKGHALGPLLSWETNGEVRFEEQTLNKTGGSFCPQTAKLDLLTKPIFEPVYIAG